MKRILAFLFLILNTGMLLAQSDSLTVSETTFIRQVLLYHPALRSTELNVNMAEAGEMGARAAFDPVWKSEYGTKDFKGTDYYDYQHSAIEWDLPPGFSVKVGADRNRGDFINPELSTPANGLAFAELSVPIGDGLFRTDALTRLQKARIEVDRSVRQLEVFKRDLAVLAAEVYWNWVASNEEVELREQIIDLADVRYRQTVRRFEQGAATAMDTLDALNNYYKRQSEYLDARSNNEAWYRLAGTMIWQEGLMAPMRNGLVQADTTWDSAADLALKNPFFDGRSPLVHPALEDLDLSYAQQNLNLRLAREQVKPDINVNAKLISDPSMISLTSNNAVFGLSAKVPILSRKERANLRKARIKQEQTLLKISEKERELIQKYEQFDNQVGFNFQNLTVARQNAANSRRLLEMENKRLAFGISNLFFVNRRESSYIDAELKRIDVIRKQRILEWKFLMLTANPEEVLEF